jgi:hypothetical protein
MADLTDAQKTLAVGNAPMMSPRSIELAAPCFTGSGIGRFYDVFEV